MIFHWAVLIGAVAVLYYNTVRNILEPTLWSNPPPLLKFEGSTAVNNLLSHAVRAEGHYHGPESIAFDGDSGTGYVSFGDGVVRSFSSSGQEIGPVFFTGGYRLDGRGNGLTEKNKDLRTWCHDESSEGRLAWNTIGENKCGRPLGLRFRKEEDGKFLYILDAYHGLFKLDLATASATHLVSPVTPILAHAQADAHFAHRVPFFFNDLDIALDGKVVFTDSSYRYTRSNNRPEILDGAPRGRLFQYDPQTGEVTLLLCGLHFPNGVQFLAPTEIEEVTTTSNEEVPVDEERGESQAINASVKRTVQQEVIVNELTRFRVLKVNTATVLHNAASLTSSCAEEGGLYQALAPNAHTASENYAISGVTHFIDNIPGLVDNVRADTIMSENKQQYLFGMGSKSVAPFSLLYTVLQSNYVREILGRVIPMRLVEKLVPRYGLVLVSNDSGELVGALHDPTGAVAMLSQASRHPLTGDLWLGSHSEPLAILPAQFVPKRWE